MWIILGSDKNGRGYDLGTGPALTHPHASLWASPSPYRRNRPPTCASAPPGEPWRWGSAAGAPLPQRTVARVFSAYMWVWGGGVTTMNEMSTNKTTTLFQGGCE